MNTVLSIPLCEIQYSATNPRRNFDSAKLDELAASIAKQGVLQPVLVRALNGTGKGGYELVAGERRLRACELAQVDEIPAIVREFSDVEVLEIQIIENSQRDDLHPLEEARGYRRLLDTKQYDVARIAERTGHSVRYVYDRVRLLELIPELQTHFLNGTITAGHAILLARLSPADQKKALGEKTGDRWNRGDGLFTHEASLFDDDEDDDAPRVKAISVKELERWIAEHVKFDRAKVDPMLFPETHELVEDAKIQDRKIIPITRSYRSHDDIRKADKERIYGEQAWKRADGLEKSKECEYSVLGVIVDGVGYGTAFAVCVNKDKCTVHWASEVRRKKQLAKARAAGDTKTIARAQKRQKRQEQSWEREARLRKQETERINKVRPQILAALVAVVRKEKVAPGSPVWKMSEQDFYADKSVIKAYGEIKTAEDMLRANAIARAMPNAYGERIAVAAKDLKPFGIDLVKLLDEHAPAENATKGTATPGTCSKCGCTEDNACFDDRTLTGTCTWANKEKTLCSACAPPPKKKSTSKRKAAKKT